MVTILYILSLEDGLRSAKKVACTVHTAKHFGGIFINKGTSQKEQKFHTDYPPRIWVHLEFFELNVLELRTPYKNPRSIIRNLKHTCLSLDDQIKNFAMVPVPFLGRSNLSKKSL